MSLKRDDWLKIVAGLGLGATGFGAAGIGPMAGMMGGLLGSAAPALPAGVPPMFEMGGPVAIKAAESMGAVPFYGAAGGAAGGAGGAMAGVNGAMKGLQAANTAQGLMGQAQPNMPPPQGAPRQQQMGPQPSAPLYQPAGGQLPPELAGLPPNDPRVIQWKQSRGIQ